MCTCVGVRRACGDGIACVSCPLQLFRGNRGKVSTAIRRTVRLAAAALLHVTGFTRGAMRVAESLPTDAASQPHSADVMVALADVPMLRKLWRKAWSLRLWMQHRRHQMRLHTAHGHGEVDAAHTPQRVQGRARLLLSTKPTWPQLTPLVKRQLSDLAAQSQPTRGGSGGVGSGGGAGSSVGRPVAFNRVASYPSRSGVGDDASSDEGGGGGLDDDVSDGEDSALEDACDWDRDDEGGAPSEVTCGSQSTPPSPAYVCCGFCRCWRVHMMAWMRCSGGEDAEEAAKRDLKRTRYFLALWQTLNRGGKTTFRSAVRSSLSTAALCFLMSTSTNPDSVLLEVSSR